MSIAYRIGFIVFLVTGLGLYYFVNKEVKQTVKRYREATEEPLVDVAAILAASVAEQSKDLHPNIEFLRGAFSKIDNQPLNARIYDFEKVRVDLRVYVTDKVGKVLFDSDNGRDEGKDYSLWNDVRATLDGRYGARSTHDNPLSKSSVLYVAAPIKVNGELIGVLSVGKPTDTGNFFIVAARKSTYALALVTFLAMTFLIALLITVVTKPIRKLTDYVRQVRDGKRASLPRLPAGELRTLGSAFDEMRDALEGKKYIENYVRTLTHELKSPISAIKGSVELLSENPPADSQKKFLSNIDRESKRMQQLIDRLLALSSLQTKHSLDEMREIPVNELVQHAVSLVRPVAEAKKVEIVSTVPEHSKTVGDEFWLLEAILNLLQNAVDFSPEQGKVELEVSINGERLDFEVLDSGPGIPDWALSKIFDQFYSLPRPDTNRKSSGIGLAIVREVAELHGGSITVGNRVGGGTISKLTIPARLSIPSLSANT